MAFADLLPSATILAALIAIAFYIREKQMSSTLRDQVTKLHAAVTALKTAHDTQATELAASQARVAELEMQVAEIPSIERDVARMLESLGAQETVTDAA